MKINIPQDLVKATYPTEANMFYMVSYMSGDDRKVRAMFNDKRDACRFRGIKGGHVFKIGVHQYLSIEEGG